jgi:histone chaperone ASF1
LEWKLTYVGSAESEKYDQILDTVFVGPVAPGQYRFVFQADPPDFSRIPADDVVGVTIILLTCCYREQEFIRVGYYVNNEYAEDALKENPPAQPQIDQLLRNILADKPRVTKFPIEWDNKSGTDGAMAEQQQQQQQQEGGQALDAEEPLMEDMDGDEEEEEDAEEDEGEGEDGDMQIDL